MAYEVTFTVVVKTFEEKTDKQLLNIIDKQLWTSPEFRDVLVISFETDAPKETKIYQDIIDGTFVHEVKNED